MPRAPETEPPAHVPVTRGGLGAGLPVLPELVASVEAAGAYARQARADGTRRVYASHWRAFSGWCATHGLVALPASAEVVAVYLSARAQEGRKVATLRVLASAISQTHLRAGFPSPCRDPRVHETWKGIRRVHGVASTQKAPLSTADLRAMLALLPTSVGGARDRALLLVGFAGGFRRAELVALELADLGFVREGLEIRVRRSKTDQEGRGALKTISYGSDPALCPVRAMQDWIACAVVTEGAVFRSVRADGRVGARALTGHGVALIVKRCVHALGLSTSAYSGHSLRAGFVTEAKRNGADDAAIMAQTSHKSLKILHHYHRRIRAWEHPASARLGL